MKPRSAKAKGRDFQNKIVEIFKTFLVLSDDDIRSVPASVNGVDVILSRLALSVFPFSIEAKKQEKLNIWSALEQAEKNRLNNTIPLLVFGRNRSQVYISMSLDDFLSVYSAVDYDTLAKMIRERESDVETN